MVAMYDDFPHLSEATPFPINGRDPKPYAQYPNTFDYTLWNPNTSVTLHSVAWDGANDVVAWADAAARDAWFDSNVLGDTLVINQMYRVVGNQVKLPIPYDVACGANYMRVVFPASPVARESEGVREWFFFVSGVTFIAPNTTGFTLVLDTFTTFQFDVAVRSVNLRQGHWAVENSADVDTFLSDPLAHTENLMDSEGDVVHARKVAEAANALWNTGAQSIVFDVAGVNPTGDWRTGNSTAYVPVQPGKWIAGEAIAPKDESLAYGGSERIRRYYRPMARQASRVNYAPTTDNPRSIYSYPTTGDGPEWYDGGTQAPSTNNIYDVVNIKSYIDANGDVLPQYTDSFDSKQWSLSDAQTPSGSHWQGTQSGTLFTVSDVGSFNPPTGFWQAVRAVYIVPTRYLSLGAEFTFGGVTCRILVGAVPEAKDVKLTRNMFGYPDDAADYTKLYTGQYARVVLQSSNGTRIEIPTEAVGASASLRTVAQFTGDGARILSYMSGTGSETVEELSIERLDATAFTAGGAWQDKVARFSIPTYQVFQNALEQAKWDREVSTSVTNISARTNRDSALDSGQAEQWNSDASAWQLFANSNADLANRGGHATAYQNAVDGARIAYANAIESSDTVKANTRDSGEAALKGAEMSRLYNQTGTENSNAVVLNTNERNRRKALRDLWTSTRKQLETTGIDLPGVDAITDTDYNGAAYGHSVIGTPGTPTGSDVIDSNSIANDMWYLNATTLADIIHTVNESKIQQAVQREGATASAVSNAVNAVAGAPSSYAKAAEKAGPVAGVVSSGTGLVGAAVGIVGQQISLGIQFSGENASSGGPGSENWRYAKSKSTDGITTHIDTWNGGSKDVDLLGMYGKQYLSEQHTLYSSMLERFYSQSSTTDNNSYAQGLDTTSTRVNTVETTNGNNLNSQQATNQYVLIDGGSVSSGSTKEITQVPGTENDILDITGFYGSADPPTLTMKEFDTGGTSIAVYGNAERSREESVDSAKRGALLVTGEDGYKVAAQSKPSAWVQGARNVEVQSVDVGEGTAARNRANADQNSLDNWLRHFYNAENSYNLVTEGNAVFSAWISELGVEAGWRDEQRKAPIAYSRVSGEDSMPEATPQGVWVRVETPIDGDVLGVADRFTQYGYMCDRLVRNPDLTLGGRLWSYWLCGRAVVKPDGAAPNWATTDIMGLLTRGVTVWTDADKVGDYEQR